MQKKMIIVLLVFIPMVGIGQGLRKKNAALEEEYLTKLQTYDSLFLKADSVNRSYTKSYKVFEKINNLYSGKYTSFTNKKKETIETYNQLMLKDSTVVLPFDILSIQSLVLPAKVLLEQFDQEIVVVMNEQPKKDYSIYLEVLSKKEQNVLLINTIGEIEKETDSLREVIEKHLFIDSILNKTNHQAVKVTFPFVDSLINLLGRQKYILRVNIQRADFRKNADPDFISLLDYPEFPPYQDYDFETFTVEGLAYEPKSPPPNEGAENEVFSYVDQPSEFPGGKDALNHYLAKNISYPKSALDKKIEGKCYLQFIVSKQGYISNVEIKRGVLGCAECDKEAVRVVKAMPNWVPGKINGKPVNSSFNLPVSFKLP